jgi:hypothetical protein
MNEPAAIKLEQSFSGNDQIVEVAKCKSDSKSLFRQSQEDEIPLLAPPGDVDGHDLDPPDLNKNVHKHPKYSNKEDV